MQPRDDTPLDIQAEAAITPATSSKDAFRNNHILSHVPWMKERMDAANAARKIREGRTRQVIKSDDTFSLEEGEVIGYPMHIAHADLKHVAKVVAEKGIVLERAHSSRLHHAIDELTKRGKRKFDNDMFRMEVLGHYQSLVVQHDWASLFKGTHGFSDGDVRLPHELCAFEFKVSSFHIIVLIGHEMDGSMTGALLTSVDDRWYAPSSDLHFDGVKLTDGGTIGAYNTSHFGQELLDLLGSQMRAICIMLDAEVAETEVVRVSEKLARSRIKAGRAPMKDYHIVSLARRHRVKADALRDPNAEKRTSPRCHWRRGHWRHFGEHKTWINWMLVGDPDLGFVDKEYRL